MLSEQLEVSENGKSNNGIKRNSLGQHRRAVVFRTLGSAGGER